MSNKNLVILIMTMLVISVSCTKDDEGNESGMQGLVRFADDPVYIDETLSFSAQIQYGFQGKPVDIAYQILEGDKLIESGKSNTSINEGGLNLFFKTEQINVPLSSQEYGGTTITVWLDPDNLVTSPEYTSEASVEAWKKGYVEIP